jgi:kynurenine formamidase
MPSRKSDWIDVTIPFANGMHGWPGNPPTVIKPHASLAKGDVCNVSVFNLNTHADAHGLTLALPEGPRHAGRPTL